MLSSGNDATEIGKKKSAKKTENVLFFPAFLSSFLA